MPHPGPEGRPEVHRAPMPRRSAEELDRLDPTLFTEAEDPYEALREDCMGSEVLERVLKSALKKAAATEAPARKTPLPIKTRAVARKKMARSSTSRRKLKS